MAWITGNRYLSESEMKNNAQIILLTLIAAGWTKNAVCGMLGNMQTESGCNPGIWESLTVNWQRGFGLTQWTPATKLKNWCDTQGLDYASGDAQLKRILYEVTDRTTNRQWWETSAYNLTFEQFSKSTQTPEYLASAFLRNYERPGNFSTENKRRSQARKWFDTLSAQTQEYVWPCPTTASISSYYGYRTPPTGGASSFHAAIDIPTATGSPVIAIAEGTVYQIGYQSARGNYVRILHKSGLVSHYQHLQGAVSSLKVGHKVAQSEQIAISGSSGIGTGPHTDVRIYRSVNTVDKDNGISENGATWDPLKYITPHAGGVILPPGTGESGGIDPTRVSLTRWVPE